MSTDNKKRILFLVTLPPPIHGSNLVNLYVTQNKELEDKYTTKILPLRYASSFEDIGKFQPVKLYRFILLIFRLISLLFRFRPDLVYFVPMVTGLCFYRECLFVILIRMFRTKIIFHLHGKGVKEKIKNPVLKFLYTWFFYNQFIILLSPLLFDDIREVAIKSRISYLPNGIDIGVKNNKRHRIESDRPFKILFLSNLVPTKGPTDLIEACKILKEKNSLFQLYFVGTPSSKDFGWEKLDRLIRLYGLDKQTHYLGPKYGNQKDDILCDSDVLVFPTVKDCFPLVILEAMAFGLPVISTYEGAIPEIVDDGVTGYLVPPKNPERIAEKLLDLINNPETRIRMGEAAKKKFEQHYTLNQFNSKLIGVIDAITRDSF